MRLSLEITQEQRHRLKVVSALSGQTMKDNVLTRVFSETSAQEDDEALRQLGAFLAPRLEEARQGKFVDKSVMQIAEETIKKLKEKL
ncbi:MAG: antitoxin [Methylococcaceae bacterium]